MPNDGLARFAKELRALVELPAKSAADLKIWAEKAAQMRALITEEKLEVPYFVWNWLVDAETRSQAAGYAAVQDKRIRQILALAEAGTLTEDD